MKKIVLSLAAAGVMSGALTQEVPNLANIARAITARMSLRLIFTSKARI